MAHGLNKLATDIPEHMRTISRQDRLRERELFRYYRPRDVVEYPDQPSSSSASVSPDAISPISTPDKTLVALAQLVTLRMNVHRAMINVISRETQYTLSEATSSGNITDETYYETDGAGRSMDKADSLCETTVDTVHSTEYPFFVVPDLQKDARFNTKPYVIGGPRYRFYAGTPLRTANGINIGTICVLDYHPRAALSAEQEKFMATISATIMDQLEMRRAAAEKDRVVRMSRGLNAFVEGRTSLPMTLKDTTFRPDPTPIQIGRTMSSYSTTGQKKKGHKHVSYRKSSSDGENERPCSNTDDNSLSHSGRRASSALLEESSDSNSRQPPVDDTLQQTLARATSLLSYSLGLARGGGVVFFDTTMGVANAQNLGSGSSTATDTTDTEDDEPSVAGNPLFGSKSTEGYDVEVPVLCQSMADDTEPPQDAHRLMGSRFLKRLIQRFPKGNIWEFDDNGIISLAEEEPISPYSGSFIRRLSVISNEQKERRRRCEAGRLQKYFRGVRSLIFVPLWDAALSRHYAGCFAWSTSTLRRFSVDLEFSFLTAFSNSISAEVGRLATMDADQKKSDFIGSISHELRSPLHGVLASAEFLAETSCDVFQSRLVDTIESCGRTLLDTINHVLDFSKINSFERTWRNKKKLERMRPGEKASVQSAGVLSILDTTDVAVICEEVIDSVYAGKVYARISPADMTESMTSTRVKARPRAGADPEAVTVLLDISAGDYTFVTQPGAIRRVIMNIFANALKYTDKGTIIVRLEMQDNESLRAPEHDKTPRKVILTITDTGKGISTGYLRTRLFTPFSQENDLAPGTGLGLSMVRSIVTMLGGTIDIRSKVGKGTEVKVGLTLERPEPSEPTPGADSRASDNPVSMLRAQGCGRTVGLFGFDAQSGGRAAVATAKILQNYIESWYHLRCVRDWTASTTPDFVIVDEDHVARLNTSGISAAAIHIIICSSPGTMSYKISTPGGVTQYLVKPFGPYKLAKVLLVCAEKTASGKASQPGPAKIVATIPTAEAEIEGFEGITDGMAMPITNTLSATILTSESDNALKATEESVAPESDGSAEPEFPFPAQSGIVNCGLAVENPPAHVEDGTVSDGGLTPKAHSDAHVARFRATNMVSIRSPPTSSPASSPVSTPASSPLTPRKRIPRILLVEDNKVNLMLLQTFMKRRCLAADIAENGKVAVDAATGCNYDIIFMDISMPVMNGFEATREIRKLEESRRLAGRRPSIKSGGLMAEFPHGVESREEVRPALIIALTGLASGRDQSEAFASGVDLFMTKPVSFREVGKLLDNWMANGGMN